jgi:hypothetical protein
MHLRLSRTKRHGRVYEYAQLVESVRRPSDGMPSHRVIGTLGALSPLEIENLRVALAASRTEKRVVVAPCARAVAAPDVIANLRYLDVAVPLALWREWGLPALLGELMPRGESSVPPADVVAALVMQRLVDPSSKLAATEWFPRTALPELLDVAPSSFNNTRLHRVLEELDAVTGDLMAKLPRRYEEREGAFASLFLDVSDATFVGHGPSLAEKAKTKEGVVARKIGIVLLCNARGYPLRWQVVPGARSDGKTMLAMLESLSGLRWVGEAPIVCDRAMGKTATLMAMRKLKLRFLTALTTTEFDSYSDERVPYDVLADLSPSESCDAKVEAEAVRRVTAAGMEPVDDNLFVLDLGLVERADETGPSPGAAEPATPSRAMAQCRRMRELVASGECTSFEEARRRLQLSSKGLGGKYRSLGGLVEEVQLAVLDGRADALSLDDLIRLARLGADEQLEQFEKLVAASTERRRRKRCPPAQAPTEPLPEPSTVKLRVVACFNQERFVEKRFRAQAILDEIRAFVDDLNRRLQSTRSRRSRASVEAEVDRKLRAHDLVEAFTVRVDEVRLEGRTRYHVDLVLDEPRWARKRRHDGFSLLVAHPDVPQTAAALARLYRAKDAVEKDFHVIKSVVEIRPVWHHSDAKVRAHVTLCMLGLLLERTLGHRLRGTCSAEAALERLEPCRLNHFAGATSAYGLTRATVEQKELLRQLGLLSLVDDEQVAETLHPR